MRIREDYRYVFDTNKRRLFLQNKSGVSVKSYYSDGSVIHLIRDFSEVTVTSMRLRKGPARSSLPIEKCCEFLFRGNNHDGTYPWHSACCLYRTPPAYKYYCTTCDNMENRVRWIKHVKRHRPKIVQPLAKPTRAPLPPLFIAATFVISWLLLVVVLCISLLAT